MVPTGDDRERGLWNAQVKGVHKQLQKKEMKEKLKMGLESSF